MTPLTRFDLEQSIMQCWGVVEDIDLIYRTESLYDDEDKMQNALLGLHTMYELKFQRLFNQFETLINQGAIK
jgi:hypothetical protein